MSRWLKEWDGEGDRDSAGKWTSDRGGEGVPLYYSGPMSETAENAAPVDCGAVLSGSARIRSVANAMVGYRSAPFTRLMAQRTEGCRGRNSRSELAGVWWERQ